MYIILSVIIRGEENFEYIRIYLIYILFCIFGYRQILSRKKLKINFLIQVYLIFRIDFI